MENGSCQGLIQCWHLSVLKCKRWFNQTEMYASVIIVLQNIMKNSVPSLAKSDDCVSGIFIQDIWHSGQASLVVFSKEQYFIHILVKYRSMVDSKVYATKLSFGRYHLLTLVCCCHFLSVLWEELWSFHDLILKVLLRSQTVAHLELMLSIFFKKVFYCFVVCSFVCLFYLFENSFS